MCSHLGAQLSLFVAVGVRAVVASSADDPDNESGDVHLNMELEHVDQGVELHVTIHG